MSMLKYTLLIVFLWLPSSTAKLEFKRLMHEQQVRVLVSDERTSPSSIAVQLPASLPRGKIGEEVDFHHSLDGTFVTGITEKIVQHPSSQAITLYGSIIGGGNFIVICSVVESIEISCAGNIRPATNGPIQYELRYDRWSGSHKISAVNVKAYEEDAIESVESFIDSLDSSRKSKTIRVMDTFEDVEDTNQIVDVMVVYTKTSVSYAGSEMIMQSLVNLAIDESNQILENSEVDLRLRLVHCMHTIDPNFVQSNSDTLLRQMSNISDGYLDEEMDVRMEVGADLIHVVESAITDNWGRGYLDCSDTSNRYCSSVSIVRAMVGFYTFFHELGHNMGLHHDPANAESGIYPYSHGHCWDSETMGCDDCRRSVLAYASCVTPLGCDKCSRAMHVSNPNVLESGNPTGVNGSANNALSLNQTKDIFSNIVKSKVDGGLIFSTTYDPSGEVAILGWRIGNGSDIESVTVALIETEIIMQSRDNVIVLRNGTIDDESLWSVVITSTSIGVTYWNSSSISSPSSSSPKTFASWFNDQNLQMRALVACGFFFGSIFTILLLLFACLEFRDNCIKPCNDKISRCNISSYKKTRRNLPLEPPLNDDDL